MMDRFFKVEKRRIDNKNYLVPVYNLEGFEQFLLPKLQFKGTQHVYFNPHDIDQLYKEKNIDPENLECNLKYDPEQDKKNKSEKPIDQPKPQDKLKSKKSEEIKPVMKVQEKRGRFRPLSRITTGNTHFIHIPFADICREIYQNLIKTQIDPNDLDSLVDINALHATILEFRLGSVDDLPRWEKILKSLKLRKIKVAVRGVGIFPVKVNTNYTRQLFIKLDGLQELIHDVASKAITQGLISEKELSQITFDKKTDMYRANQQHVTFLQTKDSDIIDAGAYLKLFSKLNLGKVNIPQIRLSMIGTFEDNDYFNEYIVSTDK